MAVVTPQYCRARIRVLNEHIRSANNQEKKWLQNGFVPDGKKAEFENWISNSEHEQSADPLTFTELTTYSTWYELHPEKVAGKMVGNTSMFFPVQVEGSKKDVDEMFASAFDEPDDEIELLELEAEAMSMALNLELKLKSGDGCDR